jgi:uncharacterized membrane protein
VPGDDRYLLISFLFLGKILVQGGNMNLQVSAIVSILFIITGFFTVLSMLKVQGNLKAHTSDRLSTGIHRVLGYIFLFIFLIMFVFMVKKVSGFTSEFSPRVTVHFVSALILIPIFLVKILIARFFKRLYPNLVILGLAIFFLSFTMVGITTGYSFMTKPAADQPATDQTLSTNTQNNLQKQKVPKADPGALGELTHKKCATCHNLERVKNARKTKTEWHFTIDKMIKYSMNPNLLTTEEKTMMIDYFTSEAIKNL